MTVVPPCRILPQLRMRSQAAVLHILLCLTASTAVFGQYTPLSFRINTYQVAATVCVPLIAPVSLIVNWGDGSANQTYTGTTATCTASVPGISHVFATEAAFTITFYRNGAGPVWLGGFGNAINADYWGTVSTRIRRVSSWGDLGITSLQAGLKGSAYLLELPSSLPSTVTSLESLFSYTDISAAGLRSNFILGRQ